MFCSIFHLNISEALNSKLGYSIAAKRVVDFNWTTFQVYWMAHDELQKSHQNHTKAFLQRKPNTRVLISTWQNTTKLGVKFVFFYRYPTKSNCQLTIKVGRLAVYTNQIIYIIRIKSVFRMTRWIICNSFTNNNYLFWRFINYKIAHSNFISNYSPVEMYVHHPGCVFCYPIFNGLLKIRMSPFCVWFR